MRRSKKTLFISIICGLYIIFAFNTCVFASTSAGTEQDPLVTKSYVDSILKSIKNNVNVSGNNNTINDKISDELLQKIVKLVKDSLGNNKNTTDTTNDNPVIDDSNKFEPVFLKAGQILIGEGGAELILRSGKGISYTEVADGVINVTTGKELLNGKDILKNNLIIVPRDDGRGILATQDAWFIVKGNYTIK